MIEILNILVQFGSLVFFILLMVIWRQLKEEITEYNRFAKRLAHLIVLLTLATTLYVIVLKPYKILAIIHVIVSVFSWLTFAALISAGIYYSEKIGVIHFTYLNPRKYADKKEEEHQPENKKKKSLPMIRDAFIVILINFTIVLIMTYLFDAEYNSSSRDNLTGIVEVDEISYFSVFIISGYLGFYGMTEELIFRFFLPCYLIYKLNLKGWTVWYIFIISNMIFALLHYPTADLYGIQYLSTFIMGMLLFWLVRKHGIESAMFAHFTNNFFAGMILMPFV